VDAPIAPVPAAAFRWMMPASALDNDPQLDWITREGVQGGRVTVSKNGNFLLCYPCRNKTLINNFAMHVDSRDQSKIGAFISTLSLRWLLMLGTNSTKRTSNQGTTVGGVQRLLTQIQGLVKQG
jgi:hypothetical protein